MLWSSQWPLSFSSASKTIRIFSFSPALHIPRPSHTRWFDHPEVFGKVSEVMNLHYTIFLGLLSLSLLGPNTLLNPVSSDTVSVLPLLWDTLRFSAMQNDRQVAKNVLWKPRAFRYGLYILNQRCCVLKHDAVCLAVDGRRFPESCSCRCAG